jgi:hypothetical protein
MNQSYSIGSKDLHVTILSYAEKAQQSRIEHREGAQYARHLRSILPERRPVHLCRTPFDCQAERMVAPTAQEPRRQV